MSFVGIPSSSASNSTNSAKTSSEEWVLPKKRAKKNKRPVEFDIELKNQYDSLSDTDTDTDTEQHEDTNKKAPKIPPIIMYGLIENHTVGMASLQKKLKEEVDIKNRGNKIVFLPKNKEDFNTIKEEIQKVKLDFHTYTPSDERTIRMVLRNIPNNVTIDEIRNDLMQQNINIIKVVQMEKKLSDNSKVKLPLYIVTFDKGVTLSQILKIKKVCYCIVEWEKLNNKTNTIQCYKCQCFGHISANCFKQVKCLKCAGPHDIKSCIAPEVNCANCEDPAIAKTHMSNSKQCPTFIKQQQNIMIRAQKKVQQKKQNTTNSFIHNNAHFPQSIPNQNSEVPTWTHTNHRHSEQATTPTQSGNNAGLFAELFALVKELFNSLNIKNIINVVKNTMEKTKSVQDSSTKFMILFEGLFDLFE